MDKEIIITYESLYDLLRTEKSRQEVQELDKNFYADVINYIKEKESILSSHKSKDSIFAVQEIEKTKKQIENILKIVKEIYEKRESKIVQLAIIASRTNPQNPYLQILLPEEKQLYETVIEILSSFRNDILDNLLEAKAPNITKKQEKILKPKDINTTTKGTQTKLVRILYPLPKFLGSDLEVYGPFEQEDAVNLPQKIADVLIENKRAKEINT